MPLQTPTSHPSVLAPVTIALAILVIAGCADTPSAPLSPHVSSAPFRATSDGSSLPTPIANSTKYRNAGKQPATGRDGNATLTARALLGPDGLVTLDVTTGQLDVAGSAPGAFDKVQIKGLMPNDLTTALWTDNYNALRKAGLASYSYIYSGLARELPLQVQANISGIDSRVDVVTLIERVKLRPDLAASQLVAPSRVPPGTPVNIGATVSELNGDVGATANCVLYVDGTEADRAAGIWVDAGGTVSCAFTQSWTNPGTRQLRVAVENVTPGDWDGTNNSVTGAVEVVAGNDFYVYADVYENIHRPDYQQDVTWSWTDGVRSEHGIWGNVVNGSIMEQAAVMQGWMYRDTTFPFARIDISQVSSGTSVMAAAFTNVQPTSTWQWSDQYGSGYQSCAYMSSITSVAGRVELQVCTYRWTSAVNAQTSEQTYFYHYRWAGEVTYHSHGYNVRWYNGVLQNNYTWNNDVSYQDGFPFISYPADQVTLAATFDSPTGVYSASVDVSLNSYSYVNTRRVYACDPEYVWTSGSVVQRQTVCWRDVSTRDYKYGYGSAYPTVQ